MASEVQYGKRICSSDGLDRISNLPPEVIDGILSHLPMRDVLKTSILSRSWKNNWKSVPHLIFDKTCLILSSNSSQLILATSLLNFVKNVLLLHKGCISKFEFDYNLEYGFSEVDKWILFLSEKTTLNDFTLLFKNSISYQLPACLFSFQTLRNLKLEGCVLKLPSQWNGFPSLTRLTLKNVDIAGGTFKSLVIRSPLLQNLNVEECRSLTSLNIHALNLITCVIRGPFQSIDFENTPKLQIVALWSRAFCIVRLNEILARLPQIQKFGIWNSYMEFLNVDSNLQVTYSHLKFIKLTLNIKDSNQIFSVLRLCRCSPNLKALDITFFRDTRALCLYEEGFWERMQKEDNMFCHLKVVKLSGFEGTLQHELSFVEFILLNAVVLETLSITWKKNLDINEIFLAMEKVTQFKKASSEAKFKLRMQS